MRFAGWLALASLVLLASHGNANADEGMWTFDNFPSAEVGRRYGFAPDTAWLDRVRLASVRLAGGCSGSFVSPEGLVLTNYHCVASCLERLSTPEKDLQASGFLAATPGEETACKGFEVNRLLEVRDVTAEMDEATKGLEGAAYNEAERAARVRLEKGCSDAPDVRCDVVPLYRGGLHHLYRYKRWTDVRLVFAPEFWVGFFGGDPDNFMFPRYNLDAAFLRVWDGGKPLRSESWFPWSAQGPREGDLVFMPGNPGSTSRGETVAQLEYERDVVFPRTIPYNAEQRGVLTEFASRGPEQARVAQTPLVYLENGLKVSRGRQRTLLDRAVMERKAAEERALRAAVAADPLLAARFGGAWDEIARALDAKREIATRAAYVAGSSAFKSSLFSWARTIVRSTGELAKPEKERRPEYSEPRLPRLKQLLFAPKPISAELEIALLSFSLSRMREDLGPDDAFAKKVLGKRSPREAAEELVRGSGLADVETRRALFEGGRKAVEAAGDTMIRLALAVDPEERALEKRIEDEIDAVVERGEELVARARFAVYGTSVYPDATFSPRLSFGTVKSWRENGAPVPAFTTIRGLFERATGRAPWDLPKSWIAAKDRLDLDTPLNYVTTTDLTGGSSGSPAVDREGRVVGLMFDGNIHSIGGDYAFDPERFRGVAVHTGAILQALEKVYGGTRIADEIRAASAQGVLSPSR